MALLEHKELKIGAIIIIFVIVAIAIVVFATIPKEKIGSEDDADISKIIIGSWTGETKIVDSKFAIRTYYTFYENGAYGKKEETALMYEGEIINDTEDDSGTYIVKRGYIYLTNKNRVKSDLLISFCRENEGNIPLNDKIVLNGSEYSKN